MRIRNDADEPAWVRIVDRNLTVVNEYTVPVGMEITPTVHGHEDWDPRDFTLVIFVPAHREVVPPQLPDDVVSIRRIIP